jgi:hypothetical protein
MCQQFEIRSRYVSSRYIATITSLTLLLNAGIALALDEAAVTSFEVEGISLSLTRTQLIQKLESDGYTLRNEKVRKKRLSKKERIKLINQGKDPAAANDEPASVLSKFLKREGRKKSKVSLLSHGEQIVSLKISLPYPDSGFDKAAEQKRMRELFGGDDQSCEEQRRNIVCKFSGATRTHRLEVSAKLGKKWRHYSISNEYDGRLAQENKERDQARKEFACFVDGDPTNYKQVFDCISAYRLPGIGGAQGPRYFESAVGMGCGDLKRRYRHVLTDKAKLEVSEAAERVPSCAVFAKVSEAWTGQTPYWSSCLDYKPGEAHLRNCVEAFVSGYYGENALKTHAVNCEQVNKQYERGLKHAHAGALPENYTEPDCALADRLAAEWRGPPPAHLAGCAGYDATHVEQHMDRCLTAGRFFTRLRTCGDVRAQYERNLVLVNGALPKDYKTLSCDQAKEVLAKAEKERQRLAEEMEQRRKKLEVMRRKRMEAEAREWNRRVEESRRMLQMLDVGTGPLVSAADLPPVVVKGGDARVEEGASSGAGGDLFSRFERGNVLKAVYLDRADLLQQRRLAVMVYVMNFGSALDDLALSWESHKNCKPFFSATEMRAMETEINKLTGADKFIHGDPQTAGAQSFFFVFTMLDEYMSQGMGPTYERARNVETLKEQAANDASRLARELGCKSEVAMTFKDNFRDFLYR